MTNPHNPPTIPDPTSVEEVELWQVRRLSVALLGADLVPSDSHDDELGAKMTADQAWYFVPTDDPVLSRPTIAEPNGKPTGRFYWAVEAVEVTRNYPHSPDDYELAEQGDRQPSLYAAVEEAARLLHEDRLRGVGEEIFWLAQSHRDRLDPDPLSGNSLIPEYPGTPASS